MNLKQLIDAQAKASFVEGYEATDEEALGIAIAHYFQWDGKRIFDTLQNALEDANFHTLNESLSEAWEKEEERSEAARKAIENNSSYKWAKGVIDEVDKKAKKDLTNS
jgi:hypothetical protein